MVDNEAKALKVLAEAEKKSKIGCFINRVFSDGSKADEATELYRQAANLFKMAKKWNEAGNAFVKGAELNLYKGEAKHHAAMCYMDAANCYRKTQPKLAADCLKKAAEIYTDMGRFTMAAKQHESIAEIYEFDNVDVAKAVYHYEKAADFHRGESSKNSANKCLLKVALYAAQLEQYKKAIDIYTEVAIAACDHNLLKYGANDYFFRAALCHLCVDVVNAQQAMKRYEEISPAFTDSRECKLMKQLIICVEEQDAEAFAEAMKKYDKVSPLDKWYKTLMLRVKKTIEHEYVDLR